MFKRILPIYQTGWFYLILFFWAASYGSILDGGLNQANQLNINLLNKLTPTQTASGLHPVLTTSDILTLQSSFGANDVSAIKSLLSYYPNSQVTLIGSQSELFMAKLKAYLMSTARNKKVLIASNNISSGQTVEVQSTMMFSNALNWFRYSSNDKIKRVDSNYFIYTPLLLNLRQSFPLLWQQKGQTYLSLPGEILKQLSQNNELPLNEHWQLNLISKQDDLVSEKLTLGFFGEVFTTGQAYQVKPINLGISNNRYYFDNLDESAISSSHLTPVGQFIEQRYSSSAFPLPQYKAIIITDHTFHEDEMLKPLLIKLTSGDYQSQGLLSIILCWILAVVALGFIWFIRHLPLKQQLISIMAYGIAIFIIQYFLFKQQQWFEALPIILLLAGSWTLLFAYQKEHDFFLSALVHQADQQDNSSHLTTREPTKSKAEVKAKKIANKQDYRLPQNFVPAPIAKKNAITSYTQVVSPAKTTPQPQPQSEEDLEQTLVIVDNALQAKAKVSHHLTVDNFGRYQVEGILGKGAMGIVYQGVDPKINRHVAIKTLQLSDDIDSSEFAEAKDRFFREAQTAGGLSHANIVTIYDVGEENNLGYIAMDLLTGAPLSLFTQPEQTLPVPLVYQLLIQITDALDYAHNQNVVHRDIKPANIIYDDDLLKVTVTDFGIAYVSDHSKTRTGIIMGSPYYMSPEQILGLKVDGRSDIFSLGVTFYQLLCGHLPFEGESIATVAYQITKAKPVAVSQRNTKLPASALRITNKAMHKDIEKRYQTMAEFKLALVNALKRDFKINAS